MNLTNICLAYQANQCVKINPHNYLWSYLVWLQCLLKSWQRTLLTPPTLTDPFLINSANCKIGIIWTKKKKSALQYNADEYICAKCWKIRTWKFTSSSVSSSNLVIVQRWFGHKCNTKVFSITCCKDKGKALIHKCPY